ncbi:hypothetical protein Bra1253DRAFT_04496, partial [Bradyrhizobium sp. WSM1253]
MRGSLRAFNRKRSARGENPSPVSSLRDEPPSPARGLLRYWLLRLKTSREKVWVA